MYEMKQKHTLIAVVLFALLGSKQAYKLTKFFLGHFIDDSTYGVGNQFYQPGFIVHIVAFLVVYSIVMVLMGR
jgi:hypothetical protein